MISNIIAQQYFCLQLDLIVLIGTSIEQFRWTLWTLDNPEKIAFEPSPTAYLQVYDWICGEVEEPETSTFNRLHTHISDNDNDNDSDNDSDNDFIGPV